MAYNLPMEDAPSKAFSKAFTQGNNLYNMLIQHAIQKAQSKRAEAANERAEEMQPYTIKHLLSQISNSEAANQRAEGLYPLQKQKYENELNPDYEFNKISRMYDLSKQKFANQDEEQTEETSPEKTELLNKLIELGILNKKNQQQNNTENLQPEAGDVSLSEAELKKIEQEIGNNQKSLSQPNKIKKYTPEQIAFGKGMEKKTGFNPFPEQKETPEQKREAETQEKIKLEHLKHLMKKGLEQQKAELKNAKEKEKVIKEAKADIPHLEDTLHSLKVMKKIAEKNPDLFGHNIFGYDTSERFARTTNNPNAGIWQSMGINPIVAAEMKLSSKGNVPALKFAIANKPNFSETQKVALGKINASIEQIQRTINNNKKISGQEHDVVVIDPNGKKFKTTSSNAKHLPEGWKSVEF